MIHDKDKNKERKDEAMIGTKNETLVNEIQKIIFEIAQNGNAIQEVKDELSKYRITGGRIERILSNPDILHEADAREVILLSEQLYQKTRYAGINPRAYYDSVEIEEARQYDFIQETYQDDIGLPMEVYNVTRIDDETFTAILTLEDVVNMMSKQVVKSNFDIGEKEERAVKRSSIDRKKLKKIKKLIVDGELIHTPMTFNITKELNNLGEMDYNERSMVLTVNEGTQIDVLEGFYRCLACDELYAEGKDVEWRFMVVFTNYTLEKAKEYVEQVVNIEI